MREMERERKMERWDEKRRRRGKEGAQTEEGVGTEKEGDKGVKEVGEVRKKKREVEGCTRTASRGREARNVWRIWV